MCNNGQQYYDGNTGPDASTDPCAHSVTNPSEPDACPNGSPNAQPNFQISATVRGALESCMGVSWA
jgi:hypothetical protein